MRETMANLWVRKSITKLKAEAAREQRAQLEAARSPPPIW